MFEYLIEDFKTYKPLLSAIKHEYEMMLIHQRETIRELEPLKVHNGIYDIITNYLHVLVNFEVGSPAGLVAFHSHLPYG